MSQHKLEIPHLKESSVRAKFLADLGDKMATSGYFQGFPSVLQI